MGFRTAGRAASKDDDVEIDDLDSGLRSNNVARIDRLSVRVFVGITPRFYGLPTAESTDYSLIGPIDY